MTDQFDKDKQKEINDFFAQFDKISNDFNKSTQEAPSEPADSQATEAKNPFEDRLFEEPPAQDEAMKGRKTRMERLSEVKTKDTNVILVKLSTAAVAVAEAADRGIHFIKRKFLIENSKDDSEAKGGGDAATGVMSTTAKRKKHKKYRLNVKKLAKLIVGIGLVCCLALGIFTLTVILGAPDINPDKIYELLTEASVLYDDEGNVIDSVFAKGGNRTNISFNDLPEDLVDAFVAIEDKTFWDHKGFNVVRIFGAIKESIFSGGKISGTSTITQQLARNLYLVDSRTDYDLRRKIAEAYYTVVLEKELTKEQILEAYVNTIYLGYNAYGIQTAAQNYFSKDVAELDLLECAALAALPKAPDSYALIKQYNSEDVSEGAEDVLHREEDYTFVYNGHVSESRRDLTLNNMFEQGMITKSEMDAALVEDLLAHMNPSQDTFTVASSYFNDYVIEQVISDLSYEENISLEKAKDLLYNGGLRVHTTMNSAAQATAEAEFSNNSNFPSVVKLDKDKAGNILNKNGNIMLHQYSNILDDDGDFTLRPDEYRERDDGGITLLKGNRLNFYKTTVQNQTDYSVEFKSMYLLEDKTFYSIGSAYSGGGVLTIPQKYKDRDSDGNLIISGDFFADYPTFFNFDGDGISVSSDNYTLRQKVVQPQGAMVITDFKTGGIKAMVGGRNTVGRQLFNRADNPRQPGSSIKPMSVYAPALQSGVDASKGGTTQEFTLDGNMYGNFWTAASIIDDAPMTFQGKQWPKNWYSGFQGLATLRYSIEQSINVNAVKVFQQVGVKNSVNFLKKLGVTTVVETDDPNDMNAAALALGGMTKGISPLEMAGAYGAIVNQGQYVEPAAYTTVTNKRGEVILEKAPSQEQVMDPGVSFIMTDMLKTTVSRGIAGRAAIGTQPVGGKTGTTTDNFDAWFVGFTPQYAAAVWIGNDINIQLSQGSASAATLWSKVMKQVCAGLPAAAFPSAPSNVISATIDSKSGQLPSELSALDDRSTVRSEYFVSGTEPKSTDSVHVFVNTCPESQYLATPYCYNHVSKFGVKRPYMPSSSVGDLAYEVPHYYCNLHNLNRSVYPTAPNASENPGFVWDGIERDPTYYPPGDNPNQDAPPGYNNDGTVIDPNDTTVNPGGTPPPVVDDGSTDGDADGDGFEDTMPEWLRNP